MNAKTLELINTDSAIKILDSLKIPSAVVSGRSLVYCNHKEELFIKGGKSCFSIFRQEYGKIKTPFGLCEVVSVPTSQGNMFAVAYGRENDVVLLFPRFASDLFECIECNTDLSYDMLSFTVKKVLDGVTDLKKLCYLILDRFNVYDKAVSVSSLSKLIEQIIMRITRREIFTSVNYNDEQYIDASEAYLLISELVSAVALCNPNSVNCSFSNDVYSAFIDGIEIAKARSIDKKIMVTRPFITTEKDLIISLIIAFATELCCYEI